MSKFLKAWEDYKSDYPNRKVKSIEVSESKDKIWFLDYHDNTPYTICLTDSYYTIERIPEFITLKGR